MISERKTRGAFHLGKKPGNFGGSKSGISDWFYLVVNPGTWRCPTVDLELVQTTRNVNGTRDSVRKFQPGKRDHLLNFPLFLGIFQWEEPTKRVPFTAEPEIPEILSKWKAPQVKTWSVNSPH